MARPAPLWTGLAVGIGLIAVAAVIGIDTARMRIPPTYAKVGPNVFPYLVTIGLLLCGGLIAWRSFKPGAAPAVAVEAQPTDWRAVGLILAALVGQIYLLKLAGFVPVAALLFFLVALAFGSRGYLRDAVIAVALAVVTYVGFTRALGLQLPAGPLGGLL